MGIFDAYIMVDWSANKKQKTGQHSVWYCAVTRTDGTYKIEKCRNPRTRRKAVVEIRQLLLDLSHERKTTLLGFDFPYSYPHGFAEALNVKERPPWKSIWQTLSGLIVDQENNRNNRFHIASDLNRRITGEKGPFWGCPRGKTTRFLSTLKSDSVHPHGLSDLRITESWRSGPQSVFKIHYNGSVGSQALVGIPYLHQLRNDPDLAAISAVWPFETGLRAIEADARRSWRILHVEIYPSLVPIPEIEGKVKDQVQVETLATHFAALDAKGELGILFRGPEDLTPDERTIVESSEGWILGISGPRR